MTDEEIDKLMINLVEKYASENQEYYFDNDDEEITTYYDLRAAFIEDFKAGMKFKEKKEKEELK